LELQKVKEMMPYFRSLMGEKVNLSIADLKKIVITNVEENQTLMWV
jgi:hypothetical protein